MTVLDDTAIASQTAVADVGGRSLITAAEDAATARDYTELRPAVAAMLRAEFPRLRDVDELYQEAWVELLDLERRGELVRNRRALLKTIAWRRAADQVRRKRAEAVDPSSPTLVGATDDVPPPDEQVAVRLDADGLRLVIEQLDARQAAALKLRFDLHLPAKEIQARLGVSPKRLEKIMTEAYKSVLAEVSAADGEESAWRRRQRSLLLACEAGIASPPQRARAQRMVERDPACRAMLRELRRTLHEIAVLLPVPVLARPERHRGLLEVLLGRLDDVWRSARELSYHLPGRHPSGGLEEAAVGGAAIGAGTTAKIVVLCLAAGGTIGVCVEGAKLLERGDPPAPKRAQRERVVEPPRTSIHTVRSVRPVSNTTVRRGRPRPTATTARETAVSSSRSRPAASPAPARAVEFGPGVTGSGPAATSPAAAPSNGGGEFGP